VTFTRTTDYARVRKILADPRCYRRMVNDAAPDIEAFTVAPREGLQFILAGDVAVFLLDGDELHFCFHPAAWGDAERIACEFLAWAWDTFPHARFTGRVPAYNRLALRLALKVGFSVCGRETDAVVKNGRVYDRVLLAILRPEEQRIAA